MKLIKVLGLKGERDVFVNIDKILAVEFIPAQDSEPEYTALACDRGEIRVKNSVEEIVAMIRSVN